MDFGDGEFEAIFIRKPKARKEWLALLDDILHKRVEKNPLVDMFKASELSIRVSDSINWTLDGEKVSANTAELIVRNQKHAVRLLV